MAATPTIVSLDTTPVLLRTRQPYRWAFGVKDGAVLLLVTITLDNGVVGYGECIATPSPEALTHYFKVAAPFCVGQPVSEINRTTTTIYHALFRAVGPSSAPRFAAQLLAGLDMALWDAWGKTLDQPVSALLGGARHDTIGYFGFAQGDTPVELAEHASSLVAEGTKVIYVKIGRGDALDLAIVRAVRDAIGDARLRLDANEAWDLLTARRMISALAPYAPEMLEQPTSSETPDALAQLRPDCPFGLAADQMVFTPAEVYHVCRSAAAHLIVLGLHETGGLSRFQQAASIAEVAGINVCIHGKLESGITTCASNQIAATIANLDDGNQYMNHLLRDDLIRQPDLRLRNGTLCVSHQPGLGFDIDENAVDDAAARYRESLG